MQTCIFFNIIIAIRQQMIKRNVERKLYPVYIDTSNYYVARSDHWPV